MGEVGGGLVDRDREQQPEPPGGGRDDPWKEDHVRHYTLTGMRSSPELRTKCWDAVARYRRWRAGGRTSSLDQVGSPCASLLREKISMPSSTSVPASSRAT